MTLIAFLPIERSPVTTMTLRTHIGRSPLLNLDFYRSGKFRFAFLALIEVHHGTIKERF
jgi:hypothetical protein